MRYKVVSFKYHEKRKTKNEKRFLITERSRSERFPKEKIAALCSQ